MTLGVPSRPCRSERPTLLQRSPLASEGGSSSSATFSRRCPCPRCPTSVLPVRRSHTAQPEMRYTVWGGGLLFLVIPSFPPPPPMPPVPRGSSRF